MPKDWVHGEKRITWRWIFRDIVFRIILYLVIPILLLMLIVYSDSSFSIQGIYTSFQSVIRLLLTYKGFGYNKPTSGQWFVTIILAVITFIVCLYFQSTSRKPHRMNPIKDFWFSLYLIFINSPSEEFFFRGFLLVFCDWFSGSPMVGVVISSFFFGIQHTIFFGASFRSVLFDTFSGFFLAFVYIFMGRSLILVIFIHAVSNLALFTVGKYITKRLQIDAI